MRNIQFKDILVGDYFIYDNEPFTKINRILTKIPGVWINYCYNARSLKNGRVTYFPREVVIKKANLVTED